MNYVKLSDGVVLNRDNIDSSHKIILVKDDIGNYIINMAEFARYLSTVTPFDLMVTIDDDQTLNGKKLMLPMINSNADIIVTGETINKLDNWDGSSSDINKLTGIATTKTDLSRIAGLTSNVQEQLNALGSNPESKISHYAATKSMASGQVAVSNSDIITAIGHSSQYYVVPSSIIIQVSKKGSTALTVANKDMNIDIITTLYGGYTVLDYIKIASNDAYSDDVSISIICKVKRIIPGA